jgi:hypothetical protein
MKKFGLMIVLFAMTLCAFQASAEDNSGLLSSADQYNKLIEQLNQQGKLRPNESNAHTVGQFPDLLSYTNSAFLGMYALRIRDNAEHPKLEDVLAFHNSLVIFLKDGQGFFEVKSMKGSDRPNAWQIYDTRKGTYLDGAAAQPYVQQMLKMLDTGGLPMVGESRPRFIYFAGISCPYCAKLEDSLLKKGLSYRIAPTELINPRIDILYLNKIFCANDKQAAFSKYVKMNDKPNLMNNTDWICPMEQMPTYTLKEINLVFGSNPTPSFYFPDGSILSGINDKNIDRLIAKSNEMESKGLYFH